MIVDWDKPIKYVGGVLEFRDQDWTVLSKDNGGPRSVVVGNGQGLVLRVYPGGRSVTGSAIFRNEPLPLWVVRTRSGKLLMMDNDRATAESVREQHRGRTIHKYVEVPLDSK